MTLDLTGEEAVALLRVLNRAIEDDRYPLSPRIRTVAEYPRQAPRCTTRTAAGETAAHRPTQALGIRI
jgi:hypothetical protein